MMRNILARGQAIGAARVAQLIDALVTTAEAELPAGLRTERLDDGIGITGPRLARRLAFDGRLRGLTLLLIAAWMAGIALAYTMYMRRRGATSARRT